MSIILKRLSFQTVSFFTIGVTSECRRPFAFEALHASLKERSPTLDGRKYFRYLRIKMEAFERGIQNRHTPFPKPAARERRKKFKVRQLTEGFERHDGIASAAET